MAGERNVKEFNETFQFKNISQKKAHPGDKVNSYSLTVALLVLAIGKSVSNYSINYFYGGKYPLPQTLLVVVLEVLKLIATIIRMKCCIPTLNRSDLQRSLKFVLPSTIYAINNNIYLAGLLLVPPPIWVILCSVRSVVTTLVYKFVLKREVTTLQFIGSSLMVTSIIIAKLGDILSSEGGNFIPFLAILYAAISSINSVGVSIYQEQIYKNSDGNFLEKQFWLYFYGVLVSTIGHIVSVSNVNPWDYLQEVRSAPILVQVILICSLFFTSFGGLVVASILKKLDNVVKEYSYSTANLFTAIICAFLFPDKFTITVFIVFSMMLLFTGIFCYEKKNFNTSANQNCNQSAKVPEKTGLI